MAQARVETSPSRSRNYFVDEAGDANLFGAKGEVIVGRPGCSHFFILGVLDVADPAALFAQMTALRTSLLADPYFKGVPSMRPEHGKTAVAFHATDDLPEVRREVITLRGDDCDIHGGARRSQEKRSVLSGFSAAIPQLTFLQACKRQL